MILRFFSSLLVLSACIFQPENKNQENVITTENVYETDHVYLNTDGKEYPADTLKRFVKIELISKATFLSKRKSAIDYIVKDNAVKKKNGKLLLPCKDSIVTISDNIVDEETHREFTYLGSVPFLNQYVVAGMYWEDYDVQFYDKKTGRSTAMFIYYPRISTDKKKIIDMYANPYDQACDFHIDIIQKEGRIARRLFTSFKNWMPDADAAFFSSDGYFYTPANHGSRYWDETGDINKNWQYLRIKLL